MPEMHRRVLRRVGDEVWLTFEDLRVGMVLADATLASTVVPAALAPGRFP
jgi:hypothetical protein